MLTFGSSNSEDLSTLVNLCLSGSYLKNKHFCGGRGEAVHPSDPQALFFCIGRMHT